MVNTCFPTNAAATKDQNVKIYDQMCQKTLMNLKGS